MDVRINSATDYDGYERQQLYLNDRCVVTVAPLCECPEDAIIGRSLVSCFEIYSLMKASYEAGKNGEELHFQTTNIDED